MLSGNEKKQISQLKETRAPHLNTGSYFFYNIANLLGLPFADIFLPKVKPMVTNRTFIPGNKFPDNTKK